MAGLGRKTFNSGDVLTAADVQGYLMDQAVMVFAGTAARGSAIPTPSAGMVAYSTATQLQVYNGSAWVDLSTGYGVATGGSSSSITVSGTAYTMLTFTSDSNLVVSKAGLFDVLACGGGAASGGNETLTSQNGGGGGGGQVVEQTMYLPAGTYAVDIGAGGAAAAQANPGGVGQSTMIGTFFIAVGGSGGGSPNAIGASGVIGGGGGNNSKAGGSTNSTGMGFAGGTGGADVSTGAGGGGGGARGAGVAGSGLATGGAGFSPSTFTGATVTDGIGGGGGGGRGGGTGGSGVDGGGNGASTTNTSGTAGATNRGGGGGGGNGSGVSVAGGSGVLYVRFKS